MNQELPGYAFVLPWSLDSTGGVNEVVKNLIAECRAAGRFRPILVEQHWPSNEPDILKERNYTHIRIRLRPLNNLSLKIPLAYLISLPSFLMRLSQLVKQHQIKVVNVHYPSLDSLSWILIRNLGLYAGKVILSFHGSDIRSANMLRGWPLFCYRYLLRQADAVVSCSEGLQTEVRLVESDITGRVIYNGINKERFFRESSSLVAAMEGLSGKEVILNIGRYEYRKGHDILISAFKKVLSVRADAHLLIVGRTGPETEATNALALRMLPESSVTLLKDLPHQAIPALMKSASLFAFSSRWVPGKLGEGFPIAILEAAVASCPIVTTRTCGADEIVEDNVSGRLVPLEDSDALAYAILDILEEPAKAIDMAKALKSKVQDNFTWESSYNAYVKLV